MDGSFPMIYEDDGILIFHNYLGAAPGHNKKEKDAEVLASWNRLRETHEKMATHGEGMALKDEINWTRKHRILLFLALSIGL